MNIFSIKIAFITLITPIVLAIHANADSIDDALKEAYQRGYNDGYIAGKNTGGSGGGGGSQGHVVGFSVPSGSGGSTSGYEAPWVYKLDNSKNTIEFHKKEKPYNPLTQVRGSRSIQELIKQFNANNTSTSTIVIENMPIGDFDKLDSLLKNSKSGNVWLAPSSK